MRQQAFFHAGDENDREFQPFRGVQRHQHRRIDLILQRIDIGHQRHVFQKVRQRIIAQRFACSPTRRCAVP